MSHQDAQNAVMAAGNNVDLLVVRFVKVHDLKCDVYDLSTTVFCHLVRNLGQRGLMGSNFRNRSLFCYNVAYTSGEGVTDVREGGKHNLSPSDHLTL